MLPHELRAVEQGRSLTEPFTGPVVLDPWLAGLLAHECVGHTSEGDNYLDYVNVQGLSLAAGNGYSYSLWAKFNQGSEDARDLEPAQCVETVARQRQFFMRAPTRIFHNSIRLHALLRQSDSSFGMTCSPNMVIERIASSCAMLPILKAITI